MQIFDVVQGSIEWLNLRSIYLTASEAPAMLGVSKYMSRNELLKQKATGIVPDVNESTQYLFDKGHEAENLARKIIEEELGEDLFPCTGGLEFDGLPLLASFDGITMDGNIVWETKLFNSDLAGQVKAGKLHDHYTAQIEQQLLVSGADKAFFTASDGTEENTVGMWYESNSELRSRIIAGWKQFEEDLKNYKIEEMADPVIAVPQMALPSLMINITGSISLIDNLGVFGEALNNFVDKINKEPESDQDFADLEATIKTLKAAEDALKAAEKNALAQTESIDEMLNRVAMFRDISRTNRLLVEKIVKVEKENRKIKIVSDGRTAFLAHTDILNKRLGKQYMPMMQDNFSAAIKGLKTISSIKNAVDTELARLKIESNQVADKIEINLNTMRDMVKDHVFLFADTRQIIYKENDDLVALVKSRIFDHQESEKVKEEATRERIRTEEAEKLKRESESDEKAKEELKQEAEKQPEVKTHTEVIFTKPVDKKEQIIKSINNLLIELDESALESVVSFVVTQIMK